MAKTDSVCLYVCLALCFLSHQFSYLQASSDSSSSIELKALIDFKSSADKANKLDSWNSSTSPCSWTGVSCVDNRVTRLVLENFELVGSFESLTQLSQLRVLSLKRNRLSDHIPDLSNLTALKMLFLSHNGLNGEFPSSLTSLYRLYRLDLSFNNFSGEIPPETNRLTHLLTLRLEENGFTGQIPSLNLQNLQDFNVTGNNFSGPVPEFLSGFPVSAFGQNPSLCGAPIQKCKNRVSSDPTRPDSGGAMASPLNPTTIPSSPTSVHNKDADRTANGDGKNSTKIGKLALIAIILGDLIILAFISLILYCCFWRSYAAKLRDGKSSKVLEGEKIVYSSSPYPAGHNSNNQQGGGFDRGRMVFFDGTKQFELEDLLRASAEMLGKGGFGTAYKAVLEDGNVVAVKRLKDATVAGKKEFEQQMEVIGRLKHPNLVGLKAYYFAREEKLLVCDYMPNGSLFWLLHGNRGPGRTPLDWTTRLKIAAGAARGLAFIHSSCKTLKLTHGNIKSTNILLDTSGNARVADFGLSVFVPAAANGLKSSGYRAPEQSDGRKSTQKSDIYSFGVLLLELLTGRCPSVVEAGSGQGSGYMTGGPVDLPRWVQSVVREEWTAEVFDLELMRYKDIEEEMVGMLQIAMACTAPAPDQRPKINQVVKMIEELRGNEVSPSHDGIDSVADSPCLSEDAGATVSQ